MTLNKPFLIAGVTLLLFAFALAIFILSNSAMHRPAG